MSVVPCKPERAQLYLLDEPLRIENALNPLPVAILQPFLDQWLADNPQARLAYIHGLDALNALSSRRLSLIHSYMCIRDRSRSCTCTPGRSTTIRPSSPLSTK